MCAALALVVLAPPAFDRLPLFHVDPNAPGWEQAGAALAGASILAFLVPSNFALYAAMYVRRWRRGVHLFAAFWLSLTLGIPTALLLLRCCAAAGVALDAPVLVLVVWNLVVPCCVLVQWHLTNPRCSLSRRLYAALLTILGAWMFTSVPYPTLIALLALLAIIDAALAGADASPVQRIDRLVTQRRASGEAEMPGLTFVHARTNGMFLGIGDFVVFAVFASHAMVGGASPLAATTVALLTALAHTMIHSALQWPERTLTPVLPASVTFGAALLACERLLVRPMAAALGAAPLVSL